MASSRRRALAGALVLAVIGTAVGVAGCGGGGGSGGSAAPPAPDAPTTEASTTTTTTAASEEEAILAAYQGYWDTWLAANDPPDPDHPDLARYATGAALNRDLRALSVAKAERVRSFLPEGSRYRHEPTIVEIDGASAFVMDCAFDDGLVARIGTDEVIDNSTATQLWNARLVDDDGWKVEDAWVVDQWDGETSCVR